MAFTRENINKNYYTTGEVADLFQVSVLKQFKNGIIKVFLNLKEVLLIEGFFQKKHLLNI